MSIRIIVTEEAAEDAIAIADYLAERSSMNTSDKFLNATTQAYRNLAAMPGMGAFRDYGPAFPGLRVWPVPKFPKYLILYQASEIELTVVRVFHGSQDIERILRSSDEG